MSKNSKERIRSLRLYMAASYALIIIAVISVLSFFTLKKTDQVLKNKISQMTSILNMQMKMNLNSFLSRMETTGTMIFNLKEVYVYDATNEQNDEYEAIRTEELIQKQLYSNCIMDNYVDFSIVYSNNHYVGKMSNGTKNLFDKALYDNLSKMISRPRTSDGFATGFRNDYTRIYYVKRVNKNAIFVSSCYASELDRVFEHPDGMNDIRVRLIDSKDNVIYSSERYECGNLLDIDILQLIGNKKRELSVNDYYIAAVNQCGKDWYVVCSIPTQVMLQEKNEVAYYIYAISFIAILLAILIGVVSFERIIKPINNIVSNLDSKAHNDLLTGLLNKQSFEESVENVLPTVGQDRFTAVIALDIDNFKGVNDTLGHAYGDKVLANVGNILRNVFGEDDLLGRIGGDEFCVYLAIPDEEQNNYYDFIKRKCEEICFEFSHNYTGDDNSYKISSSIGAAIFPTHGTSFTKLYNCADRALYESKNKGKDTYTIYTKNLNI